MDRLANYLLSDVPHAPYLVVSLWSLRQFYDGPVRIHAWQRARETADRIAVDFNDVHVVTREARWRGRDDYLFDKIVLMMDWHDYGAGMLLDADTLVTGPVDEIFEGVERCGFVATQFNEWTTRGRNMQRRIGNLRKYPQLDQDLVSAVLSKPHPAFNVGVFGARPGSPVLPDWYRWTLTARKEFIGDEIALQPLQCRYVPRGEMAVVDGRYNHSPRVQPPEDKPVSIWHGHGDCFTKPEKSLEGVAMWWPLYQRGLKENWGGMAEWKDGCRNRWIRRLEDRGG